MTTLIVSDSDLSIDARVKKHVKYFRKYGSVHTFARKPDGSEDVFHQLVDTGFSQREKYQILLNSILGWNKNTIELVLRKQRSKANQINGLHSYDIVVINDVKSLPYSEFFPNSKIILDAHEWEIGRNSSLKWTIVHVPYLKSIISKYMDRVEHAFTVCQSIADKYKKITGRRFEILRNLPEYRESKGDGHIEQPIRLVHHGAALRSRRIENLIEVVESLSDNYSLDLYLVPTDKEYFDKLSLTVQSCRKVTMKRPVAPEEITRVLSEYDIGLFLLKPVNQNYKYALPNKIFDFIQAGLCIITTPNIEMRKIIEKYGVGCVSKDYSLNSFMQSIQNLSLEDIKRHKSYSLAASKELNFEVESKILDRVVFSQ